ncbi:hypothetical protein POJ06DRAFT_96926 [Lipomyces tetrasporus]|uniref:Uncharacterized protein n=1 Tax=Lipomyces tetrasporus TaxID=54092 RepID=A0AAD7VTG4_9ASCO|nr:uncharacterized protein POJ06DRAFT_96926 [Lipomyces tetrasporus]KAJ8101438.1 hypothetical protein POJ06DRAFT_96926 [Lipomyces tetrasporus]
MRPSHNYSTTGVLFATLVLADSVVAGSGASSFLIFKRHASPEDASRLSFLKPATDSSSQEPPFSQQSHKEFLSSAGRLLPIEINENAPAYRSARLRNATVETDDMSQVDVRVYVDNERCERSWTIAGYDIACDSIPRPTRTSEYADRPRSGLEELGGLDVESVMYRVPVETRAPANSEYKEDGHREPALERKVITASGNRVIVGGRASRDTRFRRGPRPTSASEFHAHENSLVQYDNLGSMATVAPQSLSNKHDHSRPRAPRITSSPLANSHLDILHTYDGIDETAIIFDKDSVVLMKVYNIIESVSDTLDDRISESGLAEKLRELPALWEHYSKQAHAYLKSPISQSLSPVRSVTMLAPWTSARLLLVEWIDRHPAAIMLLGLLLIMCLL